MKESPPSFDVTLVAAVSRDGFISTGAGVPWDLPADRKHFRAITSDQWLLVGRRTFDEMTGWFQNHTVFVLSGSPTFTPTVGRRVGNASEAILLAREAAKTLWVIGGGKTYAEAMPFASRLILTRVDDELDSGIPFPIIDPERWALKESLPHPADARHAHAFTIQVWDRKRVRV